MLSLQLGKRDDSPLTILCIGAHCDDIEIGCGGTLLTLLRNNPRHSVHWMICCSSEQRRREAKESARSFLGADGLEQHLIIHDFRDGFLPYRGEEVKDCFEDLKGKVTPDLIFTHYRQDLHQDHRLVSELTLNTYRDHMILEYEIPKYDGDLGTPSAFVHLDEEAVAQKIRFIHEAFPTQREKPWFDEETFRGLMRLRGMESASPTRYAEAFYSRKSVLEIS